MNKAKDVIAKQSGKKSLHANFYVITWRPQQNLHSQINIFGRKCDRFSAVWSPEWAAIYAAVPGEQLGVRCLAQGHLSRGIEGGRGTVNSLHPPTIPAGTETRTHNLWVTSPLFPR